MDAKIVKRSVLLHILILACSILTAQVALEGNPTFVNNTGQTPFYSEYRDIFINILVASITIQTGALVYNIATKSPNAKKNTVKYIIGIAITGIILTMI